jgi:enediyne biosynthesis protein E4
VGTKSNRDAMGSRVRVVSGELSQIREIAGGGSYLSQSDLRANFGLSKANIAQTVEIKWPSGQTQTFHDVPANKFYLVTEGQNELRLQQFGAAHSLQK